MKLLKKTGATILSVSLLAGACLLISSSTNAAPKELSAQPKVVVKEDLLIHTQEDTSVPKYIFAFVGDGMSHVQVNAAQVYQGTLNNKDEVAIDPLAFTQFPVLGNMYTQDATSFCPDSASTATSMMTGYKTHSGVIGLGIDKTTVLDTLPELLKEEGYKIGVVSTVTLNHATPAASYAHNVSRNNYYDIALEMATSNFDYFAGGELSESGKEDGEKDVYTILEENGYTIVRDKDAMNALDGDDEKIYAITPGLETGNAMPYSIDTPEDAVTLADHVSNGINVLDNDDKGFFMWIESGKIDWAGHANDARANIGETIAFDEAIQEAIKFYNEHPDETLIIVTGDHETGGMTIGQASTGYDTAFALLQNQTMSYDEFDNVVADILAEDPTPSFDDVLPTITQNFGLVVEATEDTNPALVLNDYDIERLEDALIETILGNTDPDKGTREYELYGGYEPLTVTLTHILNEKAGIGWSSYSHTGVPVAVYAIGVNAQEFGGSYDNTQLFHKLAEMTNVK